ncbi:TetR/AcrR family transcriptional regulator [Corticibacter populi]|uniref:TetR/AcrR family transcriptional regulator n=1 Tax=Corticibacter populi TaxID=1550736 RepID=A0A3M6QZJ9_9BURK|nr:TetR/AcrR family transcriptional regulator [Corticibacter populi]RMX08375.1 TetR/AcrR family transcriptional regulator [Corticibacter populi]RZS35670.1 TetR family transcriptional regulator [Corticibacter populi]
MPTSPALASAIASPSKRRRLKPEARIEEILDAALIEFSEHGYAGTRMDDIAQRAGLSKGGLYAHFASKEQLLEALLTRQLQPRLIAESFLMAEQDNVADMIERFLDELYEQLLTPASLAIVRLLITEGFRLPELTRAWLLQHRQTFIDAQRAVFEQCIARGRLQRSALTEHPELLNAPPIMALTASIALGNQAPSNMLAEARQAHRRMLTDMLRPPAPADGSTSGQPGAGASRPRRAGA